MFGRCAEGGEEDGGAAMTEAVVLQLPPDKALFGVTVVRWWCVGGAVVVGGTDEVPSPSPIAPA